MGLFKTSPAETFHKATHALHRQQWKKAFPLLRKSAEEGYSPAQFQYAALLEQGTGIEQNIEEAILWYEKAALQNHQKAMMALARLLQQHPAVFGNTAKAYMWYQRALDAAEDGSSEDENQKAIRKDMEAIHDTAMKERESLTDQAHAAYAAEEYEKAFRLFAEGARIGSEKCQMNCGIMLAKGQGTERDWETALYWLELAAQGGMTYAQYICGEIYKDGLGTTPDPEKAFCHYLQAAYWGHADSQYQCGRMLYEMEGIPLRLTAFSYDAAAQKWLEMAAAQGQKDASLLLAEMAEDLEIDSSIEEQYQKGRAAYQSGDPAGALHLLERPRNALYFPALSACVKIYLEQNELSEAIQTRQQAFLEAKYVKDSPYEEDWEEIERLLAPYQNRFSDEIL